MTPPHRRCQVSPAAIDLATAVGGQPGGPIGYDSLPKVPAQNEGAANSRRGAMKLPCSKGEEPPEAYLIQVQVTTQFSGWQEGETAVQVTLASADPDRSPTP